MKEQDWTYVSEYRRYKNEDKHTTQLYFEGEWIDINTDMTSMVDRQKKKWIYK